MHKYTDTYIHTYIHIQIYTCIRSHLHTYVHYIHAYARIVTIQMMRRGSIALLILIVCNLFMICQSYPVRLIFFKKPYKAMKLGDSEVSMVATDIETELEIAATKSVQNV